MADSRRDLWTLFILVSNLLLFVNLIFLCLFIIAYLAFHLARITLSPRAPAAPEATV